MKKLLCVMVLAAGVLAIITINNCGGDSGGSSSSSSSVSLEGLDGMSGVAVDSSFSYEFDAAVDTSTVSASTFFIVPTLASASANIYSAKSEYSATTCNTDYALDASVECDSSTSCTLDPANDLEEGTSYTACLNSSILYADTSSWLIRSAYAGDSITPVAITFVTESSSFGIAAVLDGRGAPISTSGTTDVDFNSITILFTQEPASRGEGSLVLECAEDDLEETDYVVSSSGSSFVLTNTDAYRYQLMNCTLVVTTQLADADGQTLAENATYSFTNGCAVDDEFNEDSRDCWEVASDGYWSSWAALLDSSSGILSFPTGGGLAYDSDGQPAGESNSGIIGKQIVVDSNGFVLTTHFDAISASSEYDVFLAGLTSELSSAIQSTDLFVVGLGASQSIYRGCSVSVLIDGVESMATENCSSASEYYVRLTVTESQISAEYSTDGISYEAIDDDQVNWPPASWSFEDLSHMVLFFETNEYSAPSPDMQATLKSVTASGVTSETQY